MQKINQWISHNILSIALYLSIVPLILFLLQFVMSYKDMSYLWYFDFNPVFLSFLHSSFFSFKLAIDEITFTYLSFLTPFFNIVFLIGAILYFITNKTEKRLLQFAFSIVLISCVINTISLLISLDMNETVYQALIYIILNCIVFYIAYVILNYLRNKDIVIVAEDASISHHKDFKILPSTKGQRFLHYLIDSFLIVILFSNIFLRNIPDSFRGIASANLISIILLFFSVIYYLFFEGILKATPGKYLTQSVVKSLKTKPVSFPSILGRTFARHIPFNAFSFFGNLGWHDSISSTIVVQNKRSTKYNLLYWAIFIIFIVLIISKLIYKLFYW